MARPYTVEWNPKARRFATRTPQGGYSFFSEEQVRGVIDNDIDVSGARMGKFGSDLKQAAQAYKDGTIEQAQYIAAVRDYRDSMAAQVKGAYLGQAASAVGGIEQMKPRDHGRVGGLLKVQYRYLENACAEFADNPDLVLGNVAGRQSIEQRSTSYAESSRYVYERMKDIADGEAGRPWVVNILEAAAHCHTKPGQAAHLSCPGQTDLGPVRYDDARRLAPGSRLCHTKCKCGSMRYATYEAALAAAA